MKKQQHYKAALYCRLSVDDGNFGGSVSIETQKILLEQYCKDHRSLTITRLILPSSMSESIFLKDGLSKFVPLQPSSQ